MEAIQTGQRGWNAAKAVAEELLSDSATVPTHPQSTGAGIALSLGLKYLQKLATICTVQVCKIEFTLKTISDQVFTVTG